MNSLKSRRVLESRNIKNLKGYEKKQNKAKYLSSNINLQESLKNLSQEVFILDIFMLC